MLILRTRQGREERTIEFEEGRGRKSDGRERKERKGSRVKKGRADC